MRKNALKRKTRERNWNC